MSFVVVNSIAGNVAGRANISALFTNILLSSKVAHGLTGGECSMSTNILRCQYLISFAVESSLWQEIRQRDAPEEGSRGEGELNEG